MSHKDNIFGTKMHMRISPCLFVWEAL